MEKAMEKQVVADDYQRMSDQTNGSKGQPGHENARSARQFQKKKWKKDRKTKGSIKRHISREWYELGVLTTWYDDSNKE